jgi:Tfp pilus assembly protein PilO
MKELGNRLIANMHVFFLLYGVYVFYGQYEAHEMEYASVESEIPDLERNIKKNQQKVSEIKDFIKKADEYKVRVEEVAKTIETVQRQLPSETNDSSIVTFFQEEMKVLNIKDPGITPGNENKAQYFISKDYKLKATGTFLQFLVFFERVNNASRIYNVHSLKLSTIDANKRGRFQVLSAEATIQAYRYNPEFKVDRGFQTQVK